MTMELYYLILFALLIIATIFTQQVSSLFSEGLLPLFGSREGIKFTGLTGRLERSITNSAISMAVILPPVLAIEVTESSTPSGILAMFYPKKIDRMVTFNHHEPTGLSNGEPKG